MELKDNCVICRVSMTRHQILRLLPCRHLLHMKCFRLNNEPQTNCPLCRTEIAETESVERKKYKNYSEEDRRRVVQCANRSEDWVALASTLGINYKTAFNWVRSGRDTVQKKGGIKPKILNEEEIDGVISWIEAECDLTLKKLQEKIRQNFHKDVALSTIGNYLEGRLFTVKQVHHEPITMNSMHTKQKRAEYVQNLNRYIQQGKQVVWIDETNINLFCRCTRGRALSGSRAVQKLPAARPKCSPYWSNFSSGGCDD